MSERKKRILLVDDEEYIREFMVELLESFGYECETAADGIEALAKIRLDIDLILLDVMMPNMDGFETAKRIRSDKEFGDLPIVMATSLAGRDDRLRAVEMGANDFVAKPIDETELRVRIDSLLRMKDAQDTIKRHKSDLESKVERSTASLRKTLNEMVEAQRKTYQAYLDTIQRLAIAAEYKDEGTAAHIMRMGNYSAVIAKGLKLSPGDVELVLHASPMHDVGKIGIPDGILLKRSKLEEKEWHVMKQHTMIGGHILKGSSSELLKAGEVIALTHHEKWNGTGYPMKLSGKDIPIFGRICAVADVFDALTTERPYKEAFSNEQAFEILKEGREIHFDPEMLDVFFDNIDEVLKIQKEFAEEPKKSPAVDIDMMRY